MLRVAPLLMLLIVVPKLFYKSGALLAFEVNRDYIANAFCINKDKPELECKGQCHLAEMLQEKEEAPDSPIIPMALEIECTLPQDDIQATPANSSIKTKKLNLYRRRYYPTPHLNVDVPPPRC